MALNLKIFVDEIFKDNVPNDLGEPYISGGYLDVTKFEDYSSILVLTDHLSELSISGWEYFLEASLINISLGRYHFLCLEEFFEPQGMFCGEPALYDAIVSTDFHVSLIGKLRARIKSIIDFRSERDNLEGDLIVNSLLLAAAIKLCVDRIIV